MIYIQEKQIIFFLVAHRAEVRLLQAWPSTLLSSLSGSLLLSFHSDEQISDSPGSSKTS